MLAHVGVAGVHVLEQLGLEAAHVLDRDVVQVAVAAGPDGDDLLLDRDRLVLALLEQLDHAGPPVQLVPRGLVEVGGEQGERLQGPELGQVDAQGARDLAHGPDLGAAADPRDRGADVDGRPHALVEQVGLQVDLAVGDRDDVGRDVGRDVVALGLDDRQAGQRAPAQVVGQLGAALQQPRVEVEHVTGVGLAAGRAAQQQRDLAVGLGLLGEVVEDDQGVLALVHPVLAHGRAGVGGDVLEGGGQVGRGADDHGVLQGPVLLQGADELAHGGGLLADGHVDALDLLVGAPVLALVDDRVQADGALAGLLVADDQLALAPADVGHGVDRLDAGLQRLLHRLALHHRRGLELQGPGGLGLDVALAVQGAAQRVDHPAQEAVADRHRQDPAGVPDLVALLDPGGVAEDHAADLAHVKVEGHAEQAAGELEQLQGHGRGHPLDPGDAVAGLGDPADLLPGHRRPEGFDVLLEGGRDVVRPDRKFGHVVPFRSSSQAWLGDPEGLAGLLEAAADAAVEQLVPDADDH